MKWLGATTVIVLSAASFISGGLAQTTAPLTYAQPLSPSGVMAVQQRLKQAGAYPGRADGVWGRDSATALERFQSSHGLQATGQLNQATAATLGLNPGELLAGAASSVPTSPVTTTAAEPLAPEVVRTIQGRLRQLGFYSGQTDGIWGPGMQSSLERFQQGRGLQPTGQLNPATTTALGLDPNNLAGQPPALAPVR
jgi:peptidoglycan hydrolase-like protein with peptidoglycan-binding domain